MYYNNDSQSRARGNMEALRPSGICVERAFQEADRYASLEIDILGFEFRDGKMFLRLCPAHGRRPYEVEFHLGRTTA